MKSFTSAATRRWLAGTALLLLSVLAAAPAMAQNCNGFANSLAVDPASQTAQEFDAANSYGPVTVTLTIKNTTTLPAGATLVWTQTSGPAVTLNTSNPLRPTFVAPSVGPAGATLGFSVQARCNGVATGSPATASVTILNVDRPPVVTALASPPIANAGQLVTLTATASDPDGDAITYSWTQIAGTSSVTLGTPGAASTTFVAPTVPAEVTLQFRVQASSGTLARTATVTVTVTAANLPPFAALSCPSVVDEGVLFRLDGTGSYDPESAALTYEWFIDEMEVGLVFSLGGESGNYVDRVAPGLGLGMTGGVEVRLRVRESPTVFTDATCAFMILDATAPVISGGGDRTVDATSPAGANVGYGLSAIDNVEGDVSADLACIPPSGSAFALDVPTDVDCEVSDLNDNLATTEFVVTVRDLTAPLIDAHDAVAVEATGPLTAVNYDPPGTFDVVDVDLLATCSPASGTPFAVGSHTITCDAEDAAGNNASPTTFMLTVHDYTAPVITVPAPITAEATSSLGAAVGFIVSASDIADPDVPVTCSANPGDVFALGLTTVDCSAQDDSGNAANASFGVTVRDTTAPLLSTIADQTLEASSPAGAVAVYVPLASDTVDADVPVACSPASGSTFALGGPHAVNCSATDDSGNTAGTSFTVTVRDTIAPVISGAADQTLEATSPAGAVATFALTAADIADPSVDVLCSANSGDTFALGATTVSCTAIDDSGNQGTAGFTITVRDTIAPVISGAADQILEATSAAGAVATFAMTATDIADPSVAVSCSADSGDTFPLGLTIVNCTATDDSGNVGNASFGITVRDTTAPLIAPHLGVVAEATGPSGANVGYASPATSDAVDGPGTATCSPASGALFPLGSTTVECNARDAAGNEATATYFDVTVVDTTPPTIAAHDPIGPVEATGPSGAGVAYDSPATSDIVDGNGTATCAPASDSTFPLGITTVECDATDTAGNAAITTTFTVWVVDTTAPVIAAHGPVGPIEATGPAGAVATYTSPSTSDAVDGAGTASCTPLSGSTFALGTTTVTCTASDAAGNVADATSFTVTVRDSTAPVIAPHVNLVAEATGPSGASVAYTSPSTSDAVDGAGNASCALASGSTFALGTTTVTCTASDAAGNAATPASFTITVRDTTAPTLTGISGNLALYATSASGAVVSWTAPTANDIVDGARTVTCTSATTPALTSGSTFPVGTTTVTCTASDTRGNTATQSFTVTVSYAWTGFFQPVDNTRLNRTKAGSAVPVKFSLGGDMGLAIFASGYPRSVMMTCGDSTLVDDIEATVNAGGSSLSYDATSGQYIYVWKTDKAWGGTCRQLQIRLADGSVVRSANFQFTR